MSGRQNACVLPGALQVRKQFGWPRVLAYLARKTVVTDELAKLGSSRAMVPIGVFLQELHERSISKALAKATKAVESSQETPPLSENITESPEVMEIQSDWHTMFMIYLMTWGLPEDKVEHE
jgi:hypothetical protein